MTDEENVFNDVSRWGRGDWLIATMFAWFATPVACSRWVGLSDGGVDGETATPATRRAWIGLAILEYAIFIHLIVYGEYIASASYTVGVAIREALWAAVAALPAIVWEPWWFTTGSALFIGVPLVVSGVRA